jgi:putative DNA primase/helicase
METQKENQTDDLREYTDLFVKHLDFIYDGEDFFRYNDNIGLWGKVHDNEIEAPHKKKAEARYAQKIKDLRVLESGWGRLFFWNLVQEQRKRQNYNLINVQNGVLDIRTKKLLPHERKYYCRTQLPVKYQPEADAPRFKRILEEIFRDNPEKIRTIQEFSGCILLPKILVMSGLVLLGTERGANNGGDVLIHILSKLIGRENTAVLDISNFVPGDNLIMIRNKLLNISYNSSFAPYNRRGFFKSLCN